MKIEKRYGYNPSDFNSDGFHTFKPDYLFSDFISESEIDFHDSLIPYYANTLLANSNALFLLKNCFCTEDNVIYGTEAIDGILNIDMNIEIEKFSDNQTIYAIGSNIEGQEDEAIFLVVDNTLSDNEFILRFVPDDDEVIPERLPQVVRLIKELK